MKDKPNEWVVISDLMSGVMAVVMLFLIVVSVKSAVDKVNMSSKLNELQSELKTKQEREQKLESLVAQYGGQLDEYDKSIRLNTEQQQKLVNMLDDLKQSFLSNQSRNLLTFSIDESKITLKDSIFSRGSACITNNARKVIPQLSKMISEFLSKFPQGRVYIEGHTDNVPVRTPVTDFDKYCTVYDDNYTLSAARAREARKLLLSNSNNSVQNRIVVAGFGSSNPLDNVDPSDAKNRRVEVRFVLDNNI
ncbi:OmpA family protein [Photobacterium carnosum]|uniref:OmpA/MotB family protein n=1 Tax=Photobacterium carnosum TaxID=2023717 RepID=UPI001E3C616A|nr:OmpA family protein [Photobacterium carnosum]MCD9557218.1 OmpA family protein [Photobacterium carnosum]